MVNTYPGREGRIIGGEQRWHQLQALGAEEAPVIELSLPLEKERELNVRLNRVGGEWDFDILEEHFTGDELLGYGFEPLDFEEHESLFAGRDVSPPPAGGAGNAGSQPRLDKRNPVTCPHCGQSFEPKS